MLRDLPIGDAPVRRRAPIRVQLVRAPEPDLALPAHDHPGALQALERTCSWR